MPGQAANISGEKPTVTLLLWRAVFSLLFSVFLSSVSCYKRWRAETGADRSLSSPQPTLEIIRECYPYYAHGRSKKGEVVIYEQTGKMQFGRLSDAGVSPFDMQVGNQGGTRFHACIDL